MPQDQIPPAPARSPVGSLRGWRLGVLILTLGCLGVVLVRMVFLFNWDKLKFSAINLTLIVRQPWEFPAGAAMGLMVGVTLIAALFGLGYLALGGMRAWRRSLPMIAERAALAPLVGAVPVSLIILGMGLAGRTSRGEYGMLLTASLAVGLLGWFRFARDMRWGEGWRRARLFLGAQPVALWALLVLLGILLIPYALSPAVESDELRYHLAAPATWLREGRIHYLSYQAFSNFPMLGEMLFMQAMALGGEEAAKAVHLGMLPVNMLLIGLLTLRLLGRARSASIPFAAGAAFAFIPTVAILAAWGWIDLFVVAYFLAFVYLAGRTLAAPRRGSGSLMGVMAAGAIGVKYTMLPLLGVLGLIWCVMLLGTATGRRSVGRMVLGVLLWAMLLGGGWYVKNSAWTGNPVYPLGYSIFGGADWSAENQSFYLMKAHTNTGMHLAWPPGPVGKIVEFLITPWTATMYFERFENNFLGPLPLMAAILALGWLLADGKRSRGREKEPWIEPARQRKVSVWMAVALAVSWAAWFATYQSNRFLLPTIGLTFAFGGLAAARGGQAGPGWIARALRLLAAFAFLYGFLFTVGELLGSSKAGAIATGLGFEKREFYLQTSVNYWRGARWLARHAQAGEKALLVGEHRTMHFKLPVVASDWFDTPQPLPWIRKTQDNDAMLDLLLKDHVRYIFINWGELGKYYLPFPAYFKDRFDRPGELERFESLWKNRRLKEIYRGEEKGDGVVIYEILENMNRKDAKDAKINEINGIQGPKSY